MMAALMRVKSKKKGFAQLSINPFAAVTIKSI